jgi:hypothetical protein
MDPGSFWNLSENQGSSLRTLTPRAFSRIKANVKANNRIGKDGSGGFLGCQLLRSIHKDFASIL